MGRRHCCVARRFRPLGALVIRVFADAIGVALLALIVAAVLAVAISAIAWALAPAAASAASIRSRGSGFARFAWSSGMATCELCSAAEVRSKRPDSGRRRHRPAAYRRSHSPCSPWSPLVALAVFRGSAIAGAGEFGAHLIEVLGCLALLPRRLWRGAICDLHGQRLAEVCWARRGLARRKQLLRGRLPQQFRIGQRRARVPQPGDPGPRANHLFRDRRRPQHLANDSAGNALAQVDHLPAGGSLRRILE
jgi:hypothetical protein